MDLTIIIPAYNEARRIPATLRTILGYLPDNYPSTEIIIVNDGSKDSTSKVLASFCSISSQIEMKVIDLQENRGKGYAIKKGVQEARGKYILVTDADLSTPVYEMHKLLRCLQEKHCIAIGSRGLRDSQIVTHQPFYREVMGRVFNLLTRWLLLPGIYDTQCGFKAFHTQDAKYIFQSLQTSGFGFDLEVLVKAHQLGIPICEIPVTWHNSRESKVNLAKDIPAMFFTILQLKYALFFAHLCKKRDLNSHERGTL